MKINKGDIVLVNKTQVCYVLSGTKTLHLVTYDEKSDSMKVYKAVPANSPQVTKPPVGSVLMHPKLQARYEQDFMTITKGNYVEFEDKDGTKHQGYVVKGGNKPSVLYDQGNKQCSGPAHLFTLIDAPVLTADEPSVMDDWAVSKYKEYKGMSQETIAFTADIYYKGESVFTVRNDGQGGSMELNLHKYDERHKTLRETFNKNAVEWAKQFGLKDEPFEIDEDWVHWYANDRILGVNARTHFARQNELMAPYRSESFEESPSAENAKKESKSSTKMKP